MNAAQILDYYVANKINESCDVRAEGEYSALVDWPNPTPVRQHRRSRAIRIQLGRAYVDDFNNLGEDEQESEGDALADRVQTALIGFDPLSEENEPFAAFP